MYVSKFADGNQATIYQPPHHEEVLQRLHLEQALFEALAKGELSAHYQPQVNLQRGGLTGFEALLRWKHPVYGDILPTEFIPIYERLGLILSLGTWVLREALRQIKTWRERFSQKLVVSVNISEKQLLALDFVKLIRESLEETSLPGSALCLEVTESLLGHEQAVPFLEQIRALGVRSSIDDFGTGYSSLAYLQNFPIDEVKLDKSFLRRVGEDAQKSTLMGAIIYMAHSLNLRVVAEGVETAAEQEKLIDLLCDGAQGFFIAMPMAAADLEAKEIFTMLIPQESEESVAPHALGPSTAFLQVLTAAVEHAPDAVMITEAESFNGPGPRIIYANKAFVAMTGYTRKGVIGQTPRILQGPGTNRKALDRISKALKSRKGVREQLINYRKDGTVFHVDPSIFPLRNASGTCTHWVSLQRNTGTGSRDQSEKIAALSVVTEEGIETTSVV